MLAVPLKTVYGILSSKAYEPVSTSVPKKAAALKIPRESTTRAVIFHFTAEAALMKHRNIRKEAQT